MHDESFEKDCLLIIQCNSGHLNGDLIACARYRVHDIRTKATLKKSKHLTHVLFIIHLPVQSVRSSFVGFQGDPWLSCHIDELKPSESGAITFEGAQGLAISDLFYGEKEEDKRRLSDLEAQISKEEDEPPETEKRKMEEQDLHSENAEGTESSASSTTMEGSTDHEEQQNKNITETELSTSVADSTVSDMCKQCVRLNSYIQASASRLQDTKQNKLRATKRVELLIKIIPRKPAFPLGEFHAFSFISSCVLSHKAHNKCLCPSKTLFCSHEMFRILSF